MKSGKVYLVGAGPGDPGLITVRGQGLIDSADAIVYDSAVGRALLPPDATETGHPELYNVGKRGAGRLSATQEEINELLVRLARDGKSVVRLETGDPFVFGTGGEEALAMNDASVAFEIVPGVTAGIAAPAYAGIPVTDSGISTSVTFVTGQDAPGKAGTVTNWNAVAKSRGTIVLYDAAKNLPAIAAALIENGMPQETPAAVIQQGTRARQRTLTATLDTIADRAAHAGVTATVITVIGYSVVLRDELRWFETRPLFGKRIIVASGAQGPLLSSRLRDLGGDVIEVPAPRIARVDLAALRDAISRIREYQWIVFSSEHSAAIFWEQLLGAGFDARALAGTKVCAVGSATAGALLEHGILVDVVPARFDEDSLVEKLSERKDLRGASVLHLTADGAVDQLSKKLHPLGATVSVVPVYRSINESREGSRLSRALENGTVDLMVFASGSAVRDFVETVGAERSRRAPAASIGPGASAAMKAAGITLKAEAKEPTVDGLVDAVQLGLE